jgi:3-methylfumaryl-CoA hydratase
MVLLRHEVTDFQGVAVSEERRLLYMARGEEWPSSEPQRARGAAEWTREFRADTRLLFRYSALTRNMSRIHYDRPFAVFANGYPGLVVQGEFVSALLLSVARQQLQSERISSVDLHALRLLYDVEPLRICGRRRPDREIEVWAEDKEGHRAIEGLVGVQDASSTEG